MQETGKIYVKTGEYIPIDNNSDMNREDFFDKFSYQFKLRRINKK